MHIYLLSVRDYFIQARLLAADEGQMLHKAWERNSLLILWRLVICMQILLAPAFRHLVPTFLQQKNKNTITFLLLIPDAHYLMSLSFSHHRDGKVFP